MWNLAYSLARSGEHRNYQAIEWELRAFGYPARDNYYTASESVIRLDGMCVEARIRIRR